MEEGQGVAVVTGGASGIGEACAQALAADGFRVVVADIDRPRAEAVAARIGGVPLYVDVGDEASVEEAAAQVEERIGAVAVLVNSAGIIQRPLRPHDMPLQAWDHVQRVDLRGTYVCCLAFGRAMLQRRAGAIVNISSVVGSRSAPLHSYAPAKAAVISMTQCLAAEWGPSGIRVNSVAPGYTLTPALKDAIDRGERKLETLTASAALQRTVEPAQVAAAVSFLASSRAAAITGVDLPVDAGWLVSTSWVTYGGLRAAG
ncbi:MAG TPA: SDR family oxidoreductase [Quisquiliibacterium sp.]|nr:SDR family oxidoreductase [Quisquiliibacterium sp.]